MLFLQVFAKWIGRGVREKLCSGETEISAPVPTDMKFIGRCNYQGKWVFAELRSIL